MRSHINVISATRLLYAKIILHHIREPTIGRSHINVINATKIFQIEVAGYPANGYSAGGIGYTFAVT